MAPTPLHAGTVAPSAAESEADFKRDVARHLYATYPNRVWRGKLPPLLYAVMVTETTFGPQGQVEAVQVLREPAQAKEVMPWVLHLIRRAGPYPAPARLEAPTKITEVWLVDKTGLFQVDTLSEGQN